MSVGICWSCDFCGGHLEYVNGYIRCSDCHVSEWSSDKFRKQAEERRKAIKEIFEGPEFEKARKIWREKHGKDD